jgi:hypothetical protein
MTSMPDSQSAPYVLQELQQLWTEEARRLLKSDDDALFLQLGRTLPARSGEPVGALPRPDIIVRRGRAWIEENRRQLCTMLHASSFLTRFMSDRNAYDAATVAVIIAGAIVANTTNVVIPVPLTVGVIVARLGLDKLCGPDWGTPSKDSATANEP